MKIITKESLDQLMKNLENVEKPIKETYTRKEAIEALRPIIKELRKRGFEYKEIAQVISEQSQNGLKLRSKEIEELCATRRRTESNNTALTQPPSSVSSDKDVSEIDKNSNGAALDDEAQITGETETE